MSFLHRCVYVLLGVLITFVMYQRIEAYADAKAEDRFEYEFRDRFCLEAVRAKIVKTCYVESLAVNPK